MNYELLRLIYTANLIHQSPNYYLIHNIFKLKVTKIPSLVYYNCQLSFTKMLLFIYKINHVSNCHFPRSLNLHDYIVFWKDISSIYKKFIFSLGLEVALKYFEIGEKMMIKYNSK